MPLVATGKFPSLKSSVREQRATKSHR
jgi:hypothetical protein